MRHSPRLSTAFLGGLMLVGSFSCSHQQPPPAAASSQELAEEEAPAPAAPAPAAEAPVAAESPKEPASEAPARMAYTNPTEQALGTLPKDVGLSAGAEAPDVTLPDLDGKEVKLRELASNGPLMVVFYRGGWCPYCNYQIHELTEAYPEFQKRSVTPVAISVDRVEEGAKTRAVYKIPFPVISDPELVAHKAFKVAQQVDEETLAKLKEFGVDLEVASGQPHHNIAVPAIFLLDRTGKVAWSHASLDYKVRPSTEQLLGVIDRVLK